MADISKKMDIIVVGGSLAGLMTSIPLLRLGHNVTILDRSPTPLLHDQGAGIVAGGETLEFFQKHDRLNRKMAVTSPQRLYLDKQGDIIDREGMKQHMTSWDLLYHLGRANFDDVDSEYLEGKTAPEKSTKDGLARYRYGCVVKDVKEAGQKVEITFEDAREGSEFSPSSTGSEQGPDKTGSMLADILIAADGPSSSLRKLLLPKSPERTYAGYVAFRGTVPESHVSLAAAKVFVERFTFFHSNGTQILAYTIPGPAGTLKKGERLVNWVWYWNFAQDSTEYAELMTDVNGKTHRFTLPTGGKMKPEVWTRQKELARESLPPQFYELVTKTMNPFVQAITDLPPPPSATPVARLLNGKAILVGDALSGFRPHTAASTGQAALHALLIEQVFNGKMSWQEYERKVLEHAQMWQERGVMLGTRSQFGKHPLAA